MNATPRVRVLIVDDQALVRGGIRLLLEQHSDVEVLGEADDGATAVRMAAESEPDVVIMDVRMPGITGVEATRLLVNQHNESDRLVKVLILTTFDDDEVVYDSLRAGAHGFLLKHMAPVKLHEAVLTIAAGQSWIDATVAGTVIRALRSVPQSLSSSAEVLARLTPREREVLSMMATGLSNGDISRQLVLSEATVKTHVARILMKTGSRDRTQAVVVAYQSGLVIASPQHG